MRIRLGALAFLLGVLPVAFWPGSTSYDALKFLLLGLFGAVWLLATARDAWDGTLRPWWPRGVALAAAGLLAVLAVSAIGATSVRLVLRTALCLGACGAVFATAAAAGPRDRRRLLVAAQIGGAASALFALGQVAGLLPGPAAHEQLAPGIGGLGNPNYVAGLAAVLLGPAVGLAATARGGRARALLAGAAALHVAVLATARAAGPVLAVAAAGLLLLPAVLARSPRWARRLVATAATLALLGSVALGLAAALPGDRVSGSPLLRANSGALRAANWRAALVMLADRPGTGAGAGNYAAAWPDARARAAPLPARQYGTIATRAHHELLQWLGETGLVGALWLAIVLVAAVRRGAAWSAEDGDPPRALRLGVVAGLLTVVVHAAVSFPLHLPATGVVVALLLGMTMPAPPETPRGARRPLAAALLLLAGLLVLGGAVRTFGADLDRARGRALLASGRAGAALPRLEAAVRNALVPGPALLDLAVARRHAGDAAGAEAALRASLREAPSFEAMHLLAETEIESGRFDAARARLDRLEACDPTWRVDAEIAYLRGLADLRQGRLDEAVARWHALVARAPRHPRVHLGLGYAAVLQGRTGAARAHYREAASTIRWNLENLPEADTAGLRGLLEVARRALASVDAAEPPASP